MSSVCPRVFVNLVSLVLEIWRSVVISRIPLLEVVSFLFSRRLALFVWFCFSLSGGGDSITNRVEFW